MSQTIGRQEPAPLSKLPRFHTTEADDAAFLAEGYGLKPDPWQKLFSLTMRWAGTLRGA